MIRPVVIKEFLAMGTGTDCQAVLAVHKEMADGLDDMTEAIDGLKKALAGDGDIICAMKMLRQAVDTLETITDDNVWPLPKYREMLFVC